MLQRPSITIVEFQNLAGAASVAPPVAGLAIELVTDLEQFGDLGVRYGGGGGGGGNIVVAGLPTSDYVLTGIVRPEGDVVQYSAILTDSVTSTVVWSHTLAVPATEAAAPGVLDRVSKSLSLVLGSPRGPLHVRARQWLTAGVLPDGRLNLYLCRMLFDLYRETGGAAEAERASACFAALPEDDRQNAMALAASASLLAEHPSADASPAERLQLATISLEQAIGLNPISAFVWEQQGRLHDAQHDRIRARVDFSSSVQLNPANADALAAYARLLAFEGNLSEAEAMARDAAEQSPSPPPWYQGVPTLLALRDGDFASAIERAELYALADRELGPVLAIMAGQGAGDSAVVNRYLPQVLDVASFRARGVLPRLRERIGDNVLIEAIREALLAAGVPQAALTETF
ncbi:tetratricopeptide repeat protein [Devosia sp. A369]